MVDANTGLLAEIRDLLSAMNDRLDQILDPSCRCGHLASQHSRRGQVVSLCLESCECGLFTPA